MHLETKQRHWYILRSVNVSFFQLKQLRFTFLSRTRLKPCLWNRGYMYLKYSVFNTPTFRIKMMKNWFVLMIQWLTHTSLVSLMDESVFLNESRMNDSITNKFFNSHLVAKWCNRHKRYLKRRCFQKMSGSILIATIDINVCSRTIHFYPSISTND